MTPQFASFALALAWCAGAQAATINTTLTVTANIALSTNVTATGTATLSGIGSGTFTASLSLTSITGASATAPYTIKIGNDTITGNLIVPTALLTGSSPSGNGSATVTGGTGAYAGATGSFPNLNGTSSGSILSGLSVTFTGPGTVNTSGSGGGPSGPPPPTITAVLDSASNTSTIAQGSIFIVKGANLAPSGVNTGFLGIPRPTTSNGVKITFTPTTGGAGTDAILVYVIDLGNGKSQLAGILPSNVPTGNYMVTVTNGSASAGFATRVVQSKLTLFTQDSTGSGLASVQNYISDKVVDLNSFTSGNGKGTTISPAKPGQFLIAYGTGMGPLVGSDNAAAPVYDFSANGVTVRAIVGGVSIPVLFAGRAGYAGEDQINFQLPANVPTGCAVPFQVSVNGQLSNTTFIAIAPDANSSACVQPGFTSTQLSQFDNGATRTIGAFSLTQFSVNIPSFGSAKLDTAGGGFTKYTGYQLAGLAQQQAQTTSTGSCVVSHVQSSSQADLVPPQVGGLDAGSVTLSGPAGSGLSNTAFTQDPGSLQYSILLGTEGLPLPGGLNVKLNAGQYTINGNGGADVGKFSASLNLGNPLTVTGGLPSTVNRSAGLTLNWTGGNSSDLVVITGSSSTTAGSGTSAVTDSWTFYCTTTAGPGTFTVPASVLSQLPAIQATSTGAGGFLSVASATNPTTFTAPLTAGGNVDTTAFLALVGTGAIVSYQ